MDLLGEEIEFEHDVDGLWGWCAAVVVARPVAAEAAHVKRRRQEAVGAITCREARGCGLEMCKAKGETLRATDGGDGGRVMGGVATPVAGDCYVV